MRSPASVSKGDCPLLLPRGNRRTDRDRDRSRFRAPPDALRLPPRAEGVPVPRLLPRRYVRPLPSPCARPLLSPFGRLPLWLGAPLPPWPVARLLPWLG